MRQIDSCYDDQWGRAIRQIIGHQALWLGPSYPYWMWWLPRVVLFWAVVLYLTFWLGLVALSLVAGSQFHG